MTWLVLGRAPTESDGSDFAAAGWPQDLTAVLSAGLAEAPHHRPESIVAWHEAVGTALQPPPPAPPPPPSEPGETRPEPRRGRWLVPGAIAVVLAGGAGYGVAVLTDDGNSTDQTTATVTELADGNVRVEQTDGGVTAAFEGPATLVVGEQATFRARCRGRRDLVLARPRRPGRRRQPRIGGHADFARNTRHQPRRSGPIG